MASPGEPGWEPVLQATCLRAEVTTPFRISLLEKWGLHGFFLELVSMEILIGGHAEAMTINHDNQIAQIRRKVQDDGIEIFFLKAQIITIFSVPKSGG